MSGLSLLLRMYLPENLQLNKISFFLLLNLEFLAIPFSGHLRRTSTYQGECCSAPSQIALSTCPCPRVVLLSPSLSLSVPLAFYCSHRWSRSLGDPACLPRTSPWDGQWTARCFTLLCDSTAVATQTVLPGRASPPPPPAPSPRPLCPPCSFPERGEQFCSLERSVAPEHNLFLTALPTLNPVIFLGDLSKVGI